MQKRKKSDQIKSKSDSNNKKIDKKGISIKLSIIFSIAISIVLEILTGFGSNLLFNAFQSSTQKIEYTITFNTGDGSLVDAITNESGKEIIMPSVPTLEYHSFYGWDGNIPQIMPEENLTFNAIWGLNIVDIRLGFNNALILGSNGKIYSIGDNELGQLGINKVGSSLYSFNEVDIALNEGDEIIDFGVGYNHSVVLTKQGQVITWGDNNIYQLGAWPQSFYSAAPLNLTDYFTMNMDPDEKIIDIEVAMFGSIAITNKNRVFTFGSNSFFGLGIGNDDMSYFYPTDITSSFELLVDEVIIDIDAVGAYYGVLGDKGTLLLWGTDTNQDNFYRNYLVDYYASPKLFNLSQYFAVDEYITKFELGDTFVYLSTNLNQIYTFGANYAGQLGNGNRIDSITPVNITNTFGFEPGEFVEKVFVGYDQSSIITTKNRLFMWGSNENNAILLESMDRSLLPYELSHDIGEITQIIHHINESVLINDSYELYIWGNNISVLRDFDISFIPNIVIFDPKKEEN